MKKTRLSFLSFFVSAICLPSITFNNLLLAVRRRKILRPINNEVLGVIFFIRCVDLSSCRKTATEIHLSVNDRISDKVLRC